MRTKAKIKHKQHIKDHLELDGGAYKWSAVVSQGEEFGGEFADFMDGDRWFSIDFNSLL